MLPYCFIKGVKFGNTNRETPLKTKKTSRTIVNIAKNTGNGVLGCIRVNMAYPVHKFK